MLRILILYFWPILLPALFYIGWYLWSKYRAQEGNPLTWKDGPWIYTIMATLLIALCCFLFIIYMNSANKGNIYTPAEYKDGKLIPGKIE